MSGLHAVRGRLLTALPDGSCRYVRDGLLVFRAGGRIVHAGRASRRFRSVPLVGGHERALVMAAFWDPHVHLPQLDVAGRYGEPLLDWLERRVFPVEAAQRDPARARRAARRFFDALDRAGTAGAGIFGAPFPRASAIALDEARRRGVPVRLGPSLMDEGPKRLVLPAVRILASLERLIARHGSAVAVVPRFALSCSPRLLAAAGRIARRRRSVVLSHVSENREEVDQVARRFGIPYARVYDRAGLLGPRSLYAHGVHLTRGELALFARRRAWLVHCPTSNEALGSGRMPLERVREAGVRLCLASDVGAGPDLSLLDVMAAYLRVHRGRARTSAAEAYRLASFSGARALGFARRGALLPGYRADFLLIDRAPARARSAEGVVRALLARGATGRWEGVAGRLYRAGRPAGTG